MRPLRNRTRLHDFAIINKSFDNAYVLQQTFLIVNQLYLANEVASKSIVFIKTMHTNVQSTGFV